MRALFVPTLITLLACATVAWAEPSAPSSTELALAVKPFKARTAEPFRTDGPRYPTRAPEMRKPRVRLGAADEPARTLDRPRHHFERTSGKSSWITFTETLGNQE